MYKRFLGLLTVLILTGCNQYSNKEKYEVGIGETITIYYSTNSCCYYCIANEGQFKHIILIDNKTIDPGPDNCEGCNTTSAFIFKANSIGTDTIKLKHQTATYTCNAPEILSENYILTVRK